MHRYDHCHLLRPHLLRWNSGGPAHGRDSCEHRGCEGALSFKTPHRYWGRTAVNMEITLAQECTQEALREAQRIKTHPQLGSQPGNGIHPP